jgi:hypothetical protein
MPRRLLPVLREHAGADRADDRFDHVAVVSLRGIQVLALDEQ